MIVSEGNFLRRYVGHKDMDSFERYCSDTYQLLITFIKELRHYSKRFMIHYNEESHRLYNALQMQVLSIVKFLNCKIKFETSTAPSDLYPNHR